MKKPQTTYEAINLIHKIAQQYNIGLISVSEHDFEEDENFVKLSKDKKAEVIEALMTDLDSDYGFYFQNACDYAKELASDEEPQFKAEFKPVGRSMPRPPPPPKE